MRHIMHLEGQTHAAALAGPRPVALAFNHGPRLLLLDGATFEVSARGSTSGSTALYFNSEPTAIVYIAGTDERRFVWIEGEVYEVSIQEPLAVHARAAGAAGGLEARAPMPGNVVSIAVAIGDTVAAGATLVIIESMKLEVAIRAPQAGRVAEINCAAGRSFEKDAVLVRLAPETEA